MTARLTDAQLETARALEDYETLWLAADPIVKFAMAERNCGDEDALQEGRLAAGLAIRSWDPAKGAFSTHIANAALGAITNWLNQEATGGIGSRRVASEGFAPDTVSLYDPADGADEDDERPTRLDRLTYQDLDNPTEFEALAQSGELQNMADRMLRFLPDEDAQFFRAVTKAGGVRAFAKAANRTPMSVSRQLKAIMAELALHSAKTCYNRETGSTGQEKNGQFYRTQHVGNPWADWAYKPTPEDIARGAAPRDDSFKWSEGAVRLGARNRRRNPNG